MFLLLCVRACVCVCVSVQRSGRREALFCARSPLCTHFTHACMRCHAHANDVAFYEIRSRTIHSPFMASDNTRNPFDFTHAPTELPIGLYSS